MRISTYNLLRGGAALTHWSQMICEVGVDLLLVQESYAPERHERPLLDFRSADKSIWSAVPGHDWGSGIFCSSGELSELQLKDFEGWCCGAKLAGSEWNDGEQPLLVFSIHAPSKKGVTYGQLVNQILDQIVHLRDGSEIVIGGDFNLTVSQRHSSESRKLAAADRAIQDRIHGELGLMNCWQTANPSQPLGQTLRWQRAPKVPYHCDGIFVPQAWKDRLQTCDIHDGDDWQSLSDHNPVVATFLSK